MAHGVWRANGRLAIASHGAVWVRGVHGADRWAARNGRKKVEVNRGRVACGSGLCGTTKGEYHAGRSLVSGHSCVDRCKNNTRS